MSFLRLQKGVLSPFEELVLTSIQEVGPGATFPQIFDKANELGPWNGRIRFVDLHMTLFRLDSCGCVYSWPDEAERDRRWRDTRHFVSNFEANACWKPRSNAARLPNNPTAPSILRT
ncbi:MAG: hypothetical protein DMG22_20775 [Acidobacteria bacterium]|nr:MAG: hypothetical protein DMG22_20775 [Acidobacteriota bacterium]